VVVVEVVLLEVVVDAVAPTLDERTVVEVVDDVVGGNTIPAFT
jgi:hypothetical protein